MLLVVLIVFIMGRFFWWCWVLIIGCWVWIVECWVCVVVCLVLWNVWVWLWVYVWCCVVWVVCGCGSNVVWLVWFMGNVMVSWWVGWDGFVVWIFWLVMSIWFFVMVCVVWSLCMCLLWNVCWVVCVWVIIVCCVLGCMFCWVVFMFWCCLCCCFVCCGWLVVGFSGVVCCDWDSLIELLYFWVECRFGSRSGLWFSCGFVWVNRCCCWVVGWMDDGCDSVIWVYVGVFWIWLWFRVLCVML